LCNFSKLIGLPDGDSSKPFCVDRFDDTAGIEGAAKNFETAFTKGFTKIDQLHSKPAIRFVAPVTIKRFTVCEPVEWRFDFNIARSLKNRCEHAFGEREDVVRRDERRF